MMSDIHLGARNDSEFFLNAFLNFSKETFFPYLQNNNITTLLLLGDIWDRRKYINFNTLSRAIKEFFDPLRDMGITIKIIYGNHDVFFKNTNDVTSIDLLLNAYPNIEIVDFAKVFNFDGLTMGLISWIHSGNIKESLDWIQNCTADVLCGHFEINNFEISDGIKAKEGFDSSIFSRFEYVFSGHFHVRSNNGQIFYLGNPYQLTWSDYAQTKVFHIFDTETRQIELIENPNNIFDKHYYDDTCEIMQFDYEKYNNKIVRIYVDTLKLASRKKFDLFVDKMTQMAYDVNVQEVDYALSDLLGEGSNDIEYTECADTMVYIKNYLDTITNANLDKNVLSSYFNEIYKVAIERSNVL